MIEEQKKQQTAFVERNNERKRGSAAARGYNYRWQKVRETWLKRAANRWCYYCLQKHKPRQTPATIIDHFIPHRGDQTLFWDKSNWRPACKPCHDRKTGRGQ